MASHKIIKNFAYGIAQKFSCSAAHFCYLACKHAEYVVNIDLLSGTIEPEVFNIERNRTLVGYCRDNLLALTTENRLPIQTAFLIARFSETGVTNSALSRIEVRITDDTGKVWVGFHEEQQLVSA